MRSTANGPADVIARCGLIKFPVFIPRLTALLLRNFTITLITTLYCSTLTAAPYIQIPKYRLQAHDLAIIVNDNDPTSIKIADYYRDRRGVPLKNVIHVQFDPHRVDIPVEEFKRLKSTVEQATPAWVQAYALTWARPYRVGCMSVTSAFAAGYNATFCAQSGCRQAPTSKLFDAPTVRPYSDLHIRPTMAVAAVDFASAKALIDRGVNADDREPQGTVYLLSTSDHNRNVRSLQFPEVHARFAARVRVDIQHADALLDKHDVLAYFTGAQKVTGLDTLRFHPGAVADHLTSYGGQLTNSTQMSSLRWLDAGATASYGTVVEPCNLPMKFPAPAVFLSWYLRGATVLEAYWKSVAWPWEGIFIGEPLASPFGGLTVSRLGDVVTVKTNALRPGNYRLGLSQSIVGPFTPQSWELTVHDTEQTFQLPNVTAPALELTRIP